MGKTGFCLYLAMERRLELTGDGSHTIRVPSLQTSYHSRFGAVQESMHVFIEAGFRYYAGEKNGPIRIFEMGFGTGLNALLTLIAAGSRPVWYETIEAFPLEEKMVADLNYHERLDSHGAVDWFRKLHRCPWDIPIEIKPGFTLVKHLALLENYRPEHQFDLIYFDAFDPDTQPELWTVDLFRKLSENIKTGGMLITYSSKGSVQRALRTAGFAVEKLPGPPGKREIVRARYCGRC